MCDMCRMTSVNDGDARNLLRDNLSAYGSTNVALAEALEVPLVTADRRLGRAPGPRCMITVIRH